jgi:hypothetical protein
MVVAAERKLGQDRHPARAAPWDLISDERDVLAFPLGCGASGHGPREGSHEEDGGGAWAGKTQLSA